MSKESILCHALNLLSKRADNSESTILISDVVETFIFINDIFKNEFLPQEDEEALDFAKVKEVIDEGKEWGILEINDK